MTVNKGLLIAAVILYILAALSVTLGPAGPLVLAFVGSACFAGAHI